MSVLNKRMRDGEIIDDHFRLVRPLGQGGMGTVWTAEDLRLGRLVAIKFLSSDFLDDPQARQRFAREPRLASKIRSPHVVQVFAQGTTADHVPYLVMELLEGEDLATHITRKGPCGLLEAGSIVEQIVRALGRAHREGLVHRDIKPHNVFLIPENDGQVFVKLLDFGIAKDVGTRVSTLTLTGEVVGSALYVSPEQLHDPQSVGVETDVWSLGVLIYEALTGRVPFESGNLPELFLRIVEGRYVPATQRRPELPAAIDAFFAQTIVVDRTRRFRSVDELGAAFARIVRANSSGFIRRPDSLSQPEEAPPARVSEPPTARLGQAWPLRNTLAVCVTVALALALAAAVLVRKDAEPSGARRLEPLQLEPGSSQRPAAGQQPASSQPPRAAEPSQPREAAEPPVAREPDALPARPERGAAAPAPAARKKKPDAPASDPPPPVSPRPRNPSPAQQNYGF